MTPQQAGKSSAREQPATIEGQWLLTWINSHGEQQTRTFTFERDKKGRFIGMQDKPVCPCDLVVIYKSNKLNLRVTPREPTRVAGAAPPNVILEPLATIYEAEVEGETMKGKFYTEGFPGKSRNFTAVRQAKTDLPAKPPTD